MRNFGIAVAVGVLAFGLSACDDSGGVGVNYPVLAECAQYAGTWSQKSEEIGGGIPTVVRIEQGCKVELLQADPRHDEENLLPDYLFRDHGKLRIQYTVKPGSLDENGNPIPLPLPDEIKVKMQGNVTENSDGSFSVGIDVIDDWCHESGTECPGAKFYRQ